MTLPVWWAFSLCTRLKAEEEKLAEKKRKEKSAAFLRKKKAKKREEQIEIHAEAYKRAMQSLKGKCKNKTKVWF